MTFKTKMRSSSGSMLTVVPKALVKLLGAESGDELQWDADISEEGVNITVMPIKQDNSE